MLKSNIDLRGLIHFGKMSGGYFITTIINNAIPFLVLPILTRYLAPEEYANIALFSFYLAISNALTGISIPAVISKNFFDQEKKYVAELIGNCVLVVFAFSITTLLLILALYPFIKTYLELDLLWLSIIPLASFSWIVFSIGLTVLRNSKKVLMFTKHQVGNTLINFAFSIFFIVVLLWGWQGRVLGIIISFVISAIIMFIYLKQSGYISFRLSREKIKKIMDIALPMIPNSFQSVVISQVGIFFIQFYFTKEILGLYSIAFQMAVMIQILVTTLNLSWSPFFYQQLANIGKINFIYLTRMLYLLIGVVIVGVLFINVFAGLILRVMTTPEYYAAKEFIPWFSIGFLFYALYSFLMPILIKFEKQNYISLVSFTNMFIMIGLNIWFSNVFGYMGVVYAYTLTYFLMSLALVWKAQRVFPLPWLKALKIWSA
jgi:O-antigen/teichoic acid export membrane protein